MARRSRPRITVTVDPDILDEIDAYVQDHEGVDRSQVVEEALRVWYARILEDALARQHAAVKSQQEIDERAAWKQIRATHMSRQSHRK
jgi:metal-responsive CopG/Arc/MetJ family transcriptional regulator